MKDNKITTELPTPTTTGKNSEFISDSGLKVKVTYPENVPEHIRRKKINRLYDILSGENRNKSVS